MRPRQAIISGRILSVCLISDTLSFGAKKHHKLSICLGFSRFAGSAREVRQTDQKNIDTCAFVGIFIREAHAARACVGRPLRAMRVADRLKYSVPSATPPGAIQ